MMKPYTRVKLFCGLSDTEITGSRQDGADELPVDFINETSVFETMRSYGGRLFQWQEHFQRLRQSCLSLRVWAPYEEALLRKWCADCLQECGFLDSTLRLSLHASSAGAAWVIYIRPFSGHPENWYQDGVALETAVPRRWTLRAQDSQIKASQYVSGVLAYLDKGERQPHELLFLSPGGMVAEGTVSNLFLFKAKRLLTPSLASGILKGVTRSVVLQLACRRGWDVHETALTRHDFYTADECFMTNTSSEVLPVTLVDGRRVGNGKPGPLTAVLSKDFKEIR